MLIKQAENVISQACSFVVSESAAIPIRSKPSLLPEIKMVRTRNNMEDKSKGDIRASPSAVITSLDSAGPDSTLKAFRRIHFFTLNRSSEVRTFKKLMAMACSTTESSPPGDIYLFYDPRLPNITRIGRTTQNPETRLAVWRSRCSPTLTIIPDTLCRRVYYPGRLEKLIHLDLEDKRRRMWCQSCNHYHLEVFEVTKQDALATVQRWRSWMEY
jgi:T5orf172 domain